MLAAVAALEDDRFDHALRLILELVRAFPHSPHTAPLIGPITTTVYFQ